MVVIYIGGILLLSFDVHNVLWVRGEKILVFGVNSCVYRVESMA